MTPPARSLSSLLILGLVAAVPGCAARPPVFKDPEAPSQEVRSQFGRIGLTWDPSIDPLGGIIPARGSCKGACVGAGRGVGIDLAITGAGLFVGVATAGSGVGAVVAAGFVALGVGFIPFAAMIGAAHGSSNSLDEIVVDEAVLSVRAAMVHREFPRGVAEAMLQFSRSHGVRVDELRPEAPMGRFDTLVTVEATRLYFQGDYEVDPELSVYLLQTVTVKRVSDGKVLHEMLLSKQGAGKAKFLDWAKDDAKKILGAFEWTDAPMGERFADFLFIQPPSPPRYPHLDRYGRMVNP